MAAGKKLVASPWMSACAFSGWPPEAGGKRPLLCPALDGGRLGESGTCTPQRPRAQRGRAPPRLMLLVGPEPRLPAMPSSPWEGARLCTWSVTVKTQALRGKAGEGPGALGLTPRQRPALGPWALSPRQRPPLGAWALIPRQRPPPGPWALTPRQRPLLGAWALTPRQRPPLGAESLRPVAQSPQPPMSPTQMWMNVPQAWPSVPTAASTLTGPLSVYATQATSWVPMAGSATVSGQWAIAPRGVAVPGGQRGSPVPARHGCRLALAEGQRFLVSQGQCWAWGLRVGPGRVGGGRETPGGQRVPEPAWPRSSVLPVSQQSGSGWGREDRAGSGRHPGPCPTSRAAGLAAGIELEVVSSCEADNGGCSHGCSRTSSGPGCTCPRGYELGEDQRTCIGASRLPPERPAPEPGACCCPGSAPGFDAMTRTLPPITPSPAPGGGGSGTRGPSARQHRDPRCQAPATPPPLLSHLVKCPRAGSSTRNTVVCEHPLCTGAPLPRWLPLPSSPQAAPRAGGRPRGRDLCLACVCVCRTRTCACVIVCKDMQLTCRCVRGCVHGVVCMGLREGVCGCLQVCMGCVQLCVWFCAGVRVVAAVREVVCRCACGVCSCACGVCRCACGCAQVCVWVCGCVQVCM